MSNLNYKYNNLSVDIECFRTDYSDNESQFVDRFSFISQLSHIKDRLNSDFIDIGPRETFCNFNLLHNLSDRIAKCGYKSRLLTSGKYFVNMEDTVNWFKQLKKVGNDMILLRLDNEAVSSLSYNNIKNYLAAASYIGRRPHIRFDLFDQIPEEVYNLLENIESDVFHNDLFFFKNRSVTRYEFKDYIHDGMYPHEFRIVVSYDGEVKLRKHLRDKTVEIIIGNLNKNNLDDIINPLNLFLLKEESQ